MILSVCPCLSVQISSQRSHTYIRSTALCLCLQHLIVNKKSNHFSLRLLEGMSLPKRKWAWESWVGHRRGTWSIHHFLLDSSRLLQRQLQDNSRAVPTGWMLGMYPEYLRVSRGPSCLNTGGPKLLPCICYFCWPLSLKSIILFL
jgi:hypothetical protein